MRVIASDLQSCGHQTERNRCFAARRRWGEKGKTRQTPHPVKSAAPFRRSGYVLDKAQLSNASQCQENSSCTRRRSASERKTVETPNNADAIKRCCSCYPPTSHWHIWKPGPRRNKCLKAPSRRTTQAERPVPSIPSP